ncbi:MAG: alpha/beta hydrolase [Planctomycetota bacterium]|nr:alpha/beta hydrolase [Planctomycetota bacterium]
MNLPEPNNSTIPRVTRLRRWVWRFVRRVLIVYTVIVAMLAGFQRSLIYGPKKVSAQEMRLAGVDSEFESVEFQSHDNITLHGWKLGGGSQLAATGNFPDFRPRPVILFFCGNAMHRAYRLQEFELLARLGADVYCFDYRGYGENAGSPTETDLAQDAHAAWSYLTADQGVAASRIVLFGESLGGGVATRLAAELCQRGEIPGGLILRSTFTSLTDVAQRLFWWLPVRYVLLDRFPSSERIGKVSCPILVLHGDQDSLIPIEIGQQLFAAAPRESRSGMAKRFVPLPGADHNDYLDVSKGLVSTAIGEFLGELAKK